MTLHRKIASNMSELVKSDGTIVLFSYKTPVAACLNDSEGKYGFTRTEKNWSCTTERHINKWLAGARAEVQPQAFFDSLI